MTEDEPFSHEEIEPTKLSLRGPNVLNTLDAPPSADAVRAQEAAMRRHLKDRRTQQDSPDDS
jgi:hypothetical protein